MIEKIIRNRRLILRNAISSIRYKHIGSTMGVLWNLFLPLLQITVFASVFSILLQYRLPQSGSTPSRFGFVIFLCSALIPWNAFADTLSRSTTSILDNAGILKKVKVDEEIFVAQECVVGAVDLIIGLLLLITFSVCFGGQGLSWEMLQCFPLLLILIVAIFGLSLILGTLNVFFRDIKSLLNVLLMTWMWLTPVVYSLNMMPFNSTMAKLLKLNPAYYFATAFRTVLFEQKLVDGKSWLIMAGVAIVTTGLGGLFLDKMRSEIRDTI